MALFSPRLPHVLTLSDLAWLLAPTYARESQVSDDLAHDRLTQAFKRPAIPDRLYDAVSAALVAAQGSRSEDTLMNAMSKKVQKKLGSIGAAPASPALAAAMVLINIEINLAPSELRTTLETDKGKKLLEQGFRSLGEFLVKQLV